MEERGGGAGIVQGGEIHHKEHLIGDGEDSVWNGCCFVPRRKAFSGFYTGHGQAGGQLSCQYAASTNGTKC